MEKEAKKLFKKSREALNKAKRSYVCKSLESVIRGYRECKTNAEERAFVKKESSHIRDLFREGDTAFQRRNVLKLLFFHLHGYPSDFGKMECLKLCSSTKYPDKRVGYLGIMVLMDENQETLFLITNCLKLDLGTSDPTLVGLALTALGDISSADMLRDLMPEVERHLTSRTVFVLKKATLAAVQITRKVPEAVDYFLSKVPALLEHPAVSVKLGGLALVKEIAIRFPENLAQLRRMCNPLIVQIFKVTFSSNHDAVVINGVPEPFLQVKALATIRTLAYGDQTSTNQFGDVLAQVVSSTEAGKGAANAVLYECLRALVALPVEPPLKVLALKILGKFLDTKDSNVRYVALQELNIVVKYDLVGVQAFQSTIIECLHEEDPSIRKRAADVIFGMTNISNVIDLTRELVSYVGECDAEELQQDACRKISHMTMRYSPSAEWHVDTLVKLLAIADKNMPEELVTGLIAFVSCNPNIHDHAAVAVYSSILEVYDSKSTFKTRAYRAALYLFGEYGSALIGERNRIKFGNAVTVVGNLIHGTSSRSETNEEILEELERTRNAGLTCLAKLGTRLHTTGVIKDEDLMTIRGVLAPLRESHSPESQQLACEYSSLLTHDMEAVRKVILGSMPEYNYTAIRSVLLGGHNVENEMEFSSGFGNESSQVVTIPAPPASAGDLALLGILGDGSSEPPASSNAYGFDLLEELTGPTSQLSLGGPTELLALPGPTQPEAPPQLPLVEAQVGNHNTNMSVIDSFPVAKDTPPEVQVSPSTAAESTVSKQKIRAILFCNEHIAVEMGFERKEQGLSDCEIFFENRSKSLMTNVLLQLAVPKYMKLEMHSASSNTLGPGMRATQAVVISNSQRGLKPLQIRYKLQFGLESGVQEFSGTATNLPAGL